MKTKIITFIIMLIVNISMVNAAISWSVTDEVLTITGTGDMPDYTYVTPEYGNSYSTAPWYDRYSNKIQSVVIKDGVTSIGKNAFRSCSKLVSVTIPNSVTSIRTEAFRDCSSLKSVTIPNSVTSIGNGAFRSCSSLASITIPNSVTSTGTYTFRDCSSLTSVTIPNSVTSIGTYTFYGCSSLNSVTIPNSVTSIGTYAFYHCSSLTSITIPNSVTSIGEWAFYWCSKLKSVTISNRVTSIEQSVFRDCSSLTSVTIPNSVTSIGNSAFRDCTSLTSVTIGNSVKSIGNYAFASYPSKVTRITCNSLIPPSIVDDSNDASIHGNPLCYIPCGTLDAYANSNWKKYCQQFIEQSSLYEIVAESNNNVYGLAKVVSQPDCSAAIVTAIPNEGCTFVKWSDGNTQTTRYLELTEDISLTAYFAKEGYTIHVYQDCNTTIE